MEVKQLIIAFLWAILFGCWVFLFAYQHEATPAQATPPGPLAKPAPTAKAPSVIKPTVPTTPLNR